MNIFNRKPKIEKQNLSLEERGLPNHSYFTGILNDGTEIKEHEYNWSAISEEQVVDHFGRKKIAMVCTQPIKTLHIFHDDLTASITLEPGEQVYQAIRSQATFTDSGQTKTSIIGRVIGKIKNGKVIEEFTIDGRTHNVLGIR